MMFKFYEKLSRLLCLQAKCAKTHVHVTSSPSYSCINAILLQKRGLSSSTAAVSSSAALSPNTGRLETKPSTVSDSSDNKLDQQTADASPFSLSLRQSSLSHHDFFGVANLFTVQDLFHARVHMGHKVTSMKPQMRNFLYGERFGMTIIDLDQTASHLRAALNVIAHIASVNGIILFVTRQNDQVHVVEKAAMKCGEYSHCRKWDTQAFSSPQNFFGCEVRLPDLVVLLNSFNGLKYEPHPVIKDCMMYAIPCVSIVDSDCNPNTVTYPIPGNDDSMSAINLYLSLFEQAIHKGKAYRQMKS